MSVTEEPVDAVVIEEPGHDLVPTPSLSVTPQVEARELVARLDVIRDAMRSAMQENVDYGRIPGIDKPSLFKPGAEKLGVLFQLDVQLENSKTWGPGDHLTVESRATVYHAPTGSRLGFGEGLCSTREKKYATRKQERICPTCASTAVIKGKAEYGGGWLCWMKRDGCGAKFHDGDPAIEAQEVGTIDNPELPDLWNTVVKMAEKRARVDAILAVTAASALFTQDVEDQKPPDAPVEAPVVPASDVPGEFPLAPPDPSPAPSEDTIDPAFANDIADELKRRAVTVSQFRNLIAGVGIIDVPEDLRSGEKRLALLAGLTVRQGTDLAKAITILPVAA